MRHHRVLEEREHQRRVAGAEQSLHRRRIGCVFINYKRQRRVSRPWRLWRHT